MLLALCFIHVYRYCCKMNTHRFNIVGVFFCHLSWKTCSSSHETAHIWGPTTPLHITASKVMFLPFFPGKYGGNRPAVFWIHFRNRPKIASKGKVWSSPTFPSFFNGKLAVLWRLTTEIGHPFLNSKSVGNFKLIHVNWVVEPLRVWKKKQVHPSGIISTPISRKKITRESTWNHPTFRL